MRPRASADLDACAGLLRAVHDRDGYPVNWPERPAEWLTPPTLLAAWVAETDGRIAGHVGLARSGPGDLAPALWSGRARVPVERTAVVGRLFASPAARGLGVGARLLARAVREARERGLHPVLDVLAHDTAAVALYEREGWSLLGTVDERWSATRTVTVHCFAAPA
ncbi:GNAT family N-acetyltransferase [Streptomyces sp. NPDC006463]|uniref:GNAT family N-acetyltransferase n=1 Tax=Streptomyces sp. NPDC006463 TaxID=3364746 RepID=UPI00369CF607